MSPIPKKEIMRRKYQQRREAGLIEIKLYVTPEMKENLLATYHNLCDVYCIPENLRPKR